MAKQDIIKDLFAEQANFLLKGGDTTTFMKKIEDFTSTIKELKEVTYNRSFPSYRNGYTYTILCRFYNTHVLKDWVKGYEKEFESNYAQFPHWGALCIDDTDKSKLWFCIFYENCSPNWNNEYMCVKAISIDGYCKPIIDDIKGIRSINERLVDMLHQATLKTLDELPNYGTNPNKEQLKYLIELGMHCVCRSGWAYRGAKATTITKEQALEMLEQYSYGKGFYMLKYSVTNNIPTLEFNKVSELDME